MSMRLEMLQVARIAPKVLGDSGVLVRNFLRTRQHPEGGFMDRSGEPDLYYSVFGLDSLAALGGSIDAPEGLNLAAFLSYIDRAASLAETLDFIHTCCLIRFLSNQAHSQSVMKRDSILTALVDRMERYRSKDGGFHVHPGSDSGSVYGSFMALGAYQDLRTVPPRVEEMTKSILNLQVREGVWTNERMIREGAVPATAAAVTFLRNVGLSAPTPTCDWLLKQLHPQGGFVAVPGSPVPDLLSTATAIHSLSGLGVDLAPIRESCLDFIDTLWTNEGSFHGHWEEDTLDVEYTFYGLLALGHLA
ncbi:MAG: hypothetical protein JWM04_317 [Verrucomicrobiales bacterium]|nr:hypothetical protein [Verrucomicrobiales bacterium]